MNFRLFSFLSLHQMVCVIWFSHHLVQVSTQFCTAWRSRLDLRYPFTWFVQQQQQKMRSIHSCVVPCTDADHWKYFKHKNSKMKEIIIFSLNCHVETEHLEYFFLCWYKTHNGLANKANKKSWIGSTVIKFHQPNHSTTCAMKTFVFFFLLSLFRCMFQFFK